MKACVVVASNRASTGVYEDSTGPLIVEALTEWGFEVGDPAVVRGTIFDLLRTGQLMAPSLHTQALSLHTIVEPTP